MLGYFLQKACFVAGTPLLTPDGDKAIETFRPGDLLMTCHEDDPNGDVRAGVVEEVFQTHAPLFDLRIGGRTIRTTSEHPFWVDGRGWTPAKSLMEGDRLQSHDGTTIVLGGVSATGELAPVYNLRVADYHTYFVGGHNWGFSVWAHNSYSPTAAEKANPHLAGKTPLPGVRGTGVNRAHKLEVELVQKTGSGTINWSASEIAFIQKNGQLPPKSVVGHHINSVDMHPNWSGDPRNIHLVRGQPENLAQHGGNFQSSTTGPLIDRADMIAVFGG